MGLFRATDPEALADAPFNYAEVGGTGAAELPVGYRGATYSTVVGSGRADFERAVAAVFDWRGPSRARCRGRPTSPRSSR